MATPATAPPASPLLLVLGGAVGVGVFIEVVLLTGVGTLLIAGLGEEVGFPTEGGFVTPALELPEFIAVVVGVAVAVQGPND